MSQTIQSASFHTISLSYPLDYYPTYTPSFTIETVCVLYFTSLHTCCTPRSSLLSWFDHTEMYFEKYKLRSSSFCNFLQSPITSSLIEPYSQTPSATPQPFSVDVIIVKKSNRIKWLGKKSHGKNANCKCVSVYLKDTSQWWMDLRRLDGYEN